MRPCPTPLFWAAQVPGACTVPGLEPGCCPPDCSHCSAPGEGRGDGPLR